MKNKLKYGTSVMKDEECLLFAETAIENGSDVNEAIQDMRMIDNLLTAERNHLLVFGTISKTKTGNYRKGSLLSTTLENVINARAAGVEM
jgi:hypothetical protein